MYKRLPLLFAVIVGCDEGTLTTRLCPVASRKCGPVDVGECRLGRQLCNTTDGTWSPCEGASWESPEICDGLDNDCDGITDDVSPRSCADPMGDCGPSETVCADGVEVCRPALPPTPESCDGRDNDCDGDTDEGLYEPCYSGAPSTLGRGICAPGVRPCGSAACFFEATPLEEVCDGLDNDCDGITDEGVATVPGCCTPAAPEICDGLDNDCDSEIDENLTWFCNGQTFCLDDIPDEVPCNGLDDDCDGLVDEGEVVTADVAIAVDVSGSNWSRAREQRDAIASAVLDVAALEPCSLFDVAQFPALLAVEDYTLWTVGGATGSEAAAALSMVMASDVSDEFSCDVAYSLATIDLTPAPRSVVMIADEHAQRRSASQTTCGILPGDALALTFTNHPNDYVEMGPAVDLNTCDSSCLRVTVREFLLSRSQ